MANKKISQLPVGGIPSGAELIEAVQGGVNVQLTAQAIADLATSGGAGTVTSVGGLSPLFTVSNPTTTPTFTVIDQAANKIYAGRPDAGADIAPTFRFLVVADIPDLTSLYLNQTAGDARYLKLSGGTLTGALTLNADASSALQPVTLQQMNAALVGLWDDRGTFDASVNAYPSSGGSGTAGAILKGDIWTISVAGTLPTGQVVAPGDTVRALIDTPGNTQGNWAIAENNLGYTPITNVLNSAQILVGSSGNVATAVSMTGDIAITNLGVTSYSGTVPVAKGGTNITSYAVGDLLYASGATTLSKLADVAVGSYLASKGVTTAPAYVAFPYVTPEMYGAVGDGSTDDITAITNAVATGLPVYFSQKNYKVSSTITTSSNTKLFGSGYGSIISTTANIAIVTIGGINNAIEGIHFQGNSTGAAQTGITAVGNGSFNQYRYSNQITNCIFTGLNFAGLYTINTIGNSSGSEHQGTYYAVNCYAYSCGTGFFMDTRGEYNTFSNCHASNCTNGLQLKGGNNNWTGGSLTDNTVNALIGSGTNDGHGVICGAKINHGNITCSSTATGFAFVGCEIVATSITLTSCTDIRFYDCDIASSPITSTSAVGTIFSNNCFRTTPTITIAAGNNPFFFGNTFPSGSTVHSLIVNTLQGGLTITQQGPTSPSTETATWTTTASAQYAHKITGTITPRATASDTFNGFWVNLAFTATANNQVFSQMKIDGAMATGGFTGTSLFALDVSGRAQIKDPASSGSTGTLELLTSGSSTIAKWSADGIYRIGNAGSPPQFSPTSDGTTTAIGGSAVLLSASGLGWNFTVTNSGAGTVSSRTLRVGGGSTTSSGTTTWSGIRGDYTINQTGSATGNNYFINHIPTITASLGTSYFIVDNSTLNSGFGTITPTAKLHIVGTTLHDGNVTFTSGSNIVLDTTTGTKIGTATNQLLGFWNATPIIQPASGNQAAVSLDTDVTGIDTVDKAVINSNFTALQTLINQLRSDLVSEGLIKGSA